MKLTPLDIKKQIFKKSVRGYDRIEVDTFMELVVREYENLIEQNAQLSKKNISLEAELKHFKEVEKTLKETLYNVQETSQLSKENSLREASLVKKEAELKAVQMVDEARAEVQRLKDEVLTLKQQKESLAARLRHLLTSQLELLEVLEMDEGEEGAIKKITGKGPSGSRRVARRKGRSDKSSRTLTEAEESPEMDEDVANDDFFKDVFTNQSGSDDNANKKEL